MKFLIINGPNLNLLGQREPDIYGRRTMADILAELDSEFAEDDIDYYQSNHEGELIDRLHEAGYGDEPCDGIVLNAGGLTHTSVSLADAVAAIPVPVVEVHLSNIAAREEWRRRSLLAPVCRGSICGFGPAVYALALGALRAREASDMSQR